MALSQSRETSKTPASAKGAAVPSGMRDFLSVILTGNRGRIRWHDVASAGVVGAGLIALAWWIGFPIHFPDSARYVSGWVSDYVPTTLPFLLRPAVMLIGPWAFVVMNIVLLSGVSVAFARTYFGVVRPLSILVAVYLSAVGVMAMTVMMDVQTVIAALAVMVLAVRTSIICWVAVLVGLLSHNAALLILPVFGTFLALVNRNWSLIPKLAIAVGAWVILTLATGWLVSGKLRLSPRYTIHFASTRIMWDVPQSIETFAAAHPDSATAKYKDRLIEAARQKKEAPFLWGEDAVFVAAGRQQMADEARPFILHSLMHHTWANVRNAVANPFRMIGRVRGDTVVDGLVRPRLFVVRQVDRFYPRLREQMKSGLQYRGMLEHSFSPLLASLAFYASLATCAIMPLAWLLGGRRWSSRLWVVLPLSVLTFVLISVAVYSNFSFLDNGRMHIRLLYVPILVAVLFWSSLVGMAVVQRRLVGGDRDTVAG